MIYTSHTFLCKKVAKTIGVGNAILQDVTDKEVSRTIPPP
ncbi:MAG: hypothetical protein ACD_2C00072G0003, partial [uncultured bacterium (gcode 4)]